MLGSHSAAAGFPQATQPNFPREKFPTGTMRCVTQNRNQTKKTKQSVNYTKRHSTCLLRWKSRFFFFLSILLSQFFGICWRCQHGCFTTWQWNRRTQSHLLLLFHFTVIPSPSFVSQSPLLSQSHCFFLFLFHSHTLCSRFYFTLTISPSPPVFISHSHPLLPFFILHSHPLLPFLFHTHTLCSCSYFTVTLSLLVILIDWLIFFPSAVKAFLKTKSRVYPLWPVVTSVSSYSVQPKLPLTTTALILPTSSSTKDFIQSVSLHQPSLIFS